MKKIYFIFLLFLFPKAFSQKAIKQENNYYFYENKGQIIDQNGKQNSKVHYLFNSGGLNVQIKKEGFSYDVYEVEKIKKKKRHTEKFLTHSLNEKSQEEVDYKFKFHRVDIDFLNANKNPEIIAEGKSLDYENYYNIPGKPEGITKVHRYQKITYKNIYPNVDLVFFKPNDTTKTIEYNFEINPGGKISDIKLKFKGAKTKLKDGKLSMNLRFGELQENIPHSWEETLSGKNSVQVGYKDLGNDVFGFQTEKDISDKKVVIDPVPTRIWATKNFNGSHHRRFNKVLEKEGFVYTLDLRKSLFNVATNGYEDFHWDSVNYGHLSKFDADGNKIYGIYIGNHHKDPGTDTESNDVNDFILDSSGNIYVGGSAKDDANGKNTITTVGAHKEHSTYNGLYSGAGNNDAFLIKFNNNGYRIWGTYLGGSGYEIIQGIEVKSSSDVIVTGWNHSGFIVDDIINAPKNTDPKIFFAGIFGSDGTLKKIAKMHHNGLTDNILLTAIDSSDNLYVGTNIAYSFLGNINGTKGTHQENIIGDSNVYLFKLDTNLQFIWGTYFGGRSHNGIAYNSNEGSTVLRGLEIDSYNDLVIAGVTTANEKIATSGTHLENMTGNYGKDMFIAKFDRNGHQIWGTYYGDYNPGTSGDDNLYAMDVDEKNNIYVAGYTSSKKNIATAGSYLPTDNGGYDEGFFSKFSSSGKQIWGSYYYDSIESICASNNFVYTFGNMEVAKFVDCGAGVAFSTLSVCLGSQLKLTASNGLSYKWTGPNGFTSTEQNPIVTSNALVSFNGKYTVFINFSGECSATYTIEVKVEDKTPPTPALSLLPDIVGDCKTIIKTIPTATDNCKSGIINATTTDALQYAIPGTYVITWKYDDGNGNTSTQTQKVTITSPALPIAEKNQTFCATNYPKISDIKITGTSIKWYNSTGKTLNLTDNLADGMSYYATQTINGCESEKIPVTIKINFTPKPTETAAQNFCTASDPTLKNLNISGTALKFYDSNGNLVPETTKLTDAKTYFISQTLNNCESEKLQVKVSVNNGNLPAKDYSETLCNDTTNDFKTINLNDFKEKIITNSSSFNFEINGSALPTSSNLKIGENKFKIKVSNNEGCYKEVELVLNLNPKPKLTLPTSLEFCNGQFAELKAGDDFSSYLWSTGETSPTIRTDKEGTYKVTVKNVFGCENSAEIVVTKSVIATIESVNIVNNNATVKLSASGDFLYSLDNKNWQNINTFNNLKNGNYTVFVKTAGGCIIGEKNFTIFSISNSFTPNGDGQNDTWKISGLENYPGSEIMVFDRYGNTVLKVITDKSPFEWNGTYNKRVLPTGNYWYLIKITDGRILNGWLTLKNRN